MVTNILVSCNYQDQKEKKCCNGASTDLELMSNFLEGQKYVFTDFGEGDDVSFLLEKISKIKIDSLLIFYFSGHCEKNTLDFSKFEINFNDLLDFLHNTIDERVEFLLILDSCNLSDNLLPFDISEEEIVLSNPRRVCEREILLMKPNCKITTGDSTGSFFTKELISKFDHNLPVHSLGSNFRVFNNHCFHTTLPLKGGYKVTDKNDVISVTRYT